MTTGIESAIQVALHGLSDRAKTTTDNIANIETNGFLAGRTNFEDSLRKALSSDTATNVAPKHTESMEATNTNGNNVNIDNETVTAIDTELRYQAMIEAMNVQFRTVRAAMG